MDLVPNISQGTITYTPNGERRPVTVISARYANEQHTSIVAETLERGAIAVSQIDAPQIWLEVLAQATPAPYVVYLDAEKIRLCNEVDAHAGELRKDLLPSDPGIEWVYREKAEEAMRFLGKLEMGEPVENLTEAEFPFLTASLPYDGETLEAAARVVYQRYRDAAIQLAHIETLRRANKAAIMAAADVPSAREAAADARW